MGINTLKAQYRGNFDKNEEDRVRRIRTISQGFVLKKFRDPKVTIEKKYELAEKIFLANIKIQSDQGDKVGETKIIIIRDSAINKPIEIKPGSGQINVGRAISFNA